MVLKVFSRFPNQVPSLTPPSCLVFLTATGQRAEDDQRHKQEGRGFSVAAVEGMPYAVGSKAQWCHDVELKVSSLRIPSAVFSDVFL